jgi:alpha-D-ribose 1-methylphosphonate 5-phosphate C-P lyase
VEKIIFSFIGPIQIARGNGLCELCIKEVEFLRRDILLEAAEEERDFICTQLQHCNPDRRNG